MLLAGRAVAQPADVSATGTMPGSPQPPQPLGYGAMPGGLHTPSAETLPKGTAAVTAVGGFGWRTGLLGADHRFGRGIGDLAFAYAPTDLITVGLALDGRYDKHFGVAPSGDDGYVGDPRLIARIAKNLGSLKLGGQLAIWVPGKDAPSIAASAISVDARALASVAAGPGTVSFDAGLRLDNSAKSVDNPAQLSLQDRVSLGVSDYHAVVGGAHFTMPSGKLYFGGEASIDLFVGSGAPGPLLRAGGHAGIRLAPQWSLLAFVEIAKVPGIDAADVMANTISQIPYEPMITGGLGLEARFGGAKHGADDHVTPNRDRTDIEVIEYAELSGVVTDETGKPIVGAKVTVKLKNNTATGVTDDKGNYTIAKVPIGKTINGTTTLDDTGAEITVSVDGKKPAVSTLVLGKGANAVAKLTLEPMLPPGQLKAVVRSAATGKPISGATLTIDPGGLTASSAADGTLSLDLAPGTYKATVTAAGHKPQTLDVTVDPNGVALKNFELPR